MRWHKNPVVTEIVTVKAHYCRINFWLGIKNEAMDRIKNADLSETSGGL